MDVNASITTHSSKQIPAGDTTLTDVDSRTLLRIREKIDKKAGESAFERGMQLSMILIGLRAIAAHAVAKESTCD